MAERNVKGEVISTGRATGELCFVDFKWDMTASQDNLDSNDIAEEIARFEDEADSLVGELEEAVERLQKNSFFEEADIIQTHILILKDAGFHRRVHKQIKTNRLAAAVALEHVLKEMIEVLESSGDVIISERAADVKDIMIRLKRKLIKEDFDIFNESLKNIKNPIVVTKELLPSLVLVGRERGVGAFVVEQGTSLSHAAILTKSFGIPVLKVENLFNLGLKNGTGVFVDATNGRLTIEPSEKKIRRAPELTPPVAEIGKTQLPVKVWINIVDPQQIGKEDMARVEGVGLYRTEILFMGKEDDFPTEDEQFIIYSSLFERCRDCPVTVRTLDIGGDKTLPYFSFGPQENPFLGFRAHRIYRYHPEIFITQLRALLKAALPGGDLRILYPMIESVDELLFVQDLLQKAIHSLQADGIKYKKEFQQGILVEVPSAVWNFRELLRYVDFASVGTNDLLQYFFAVDRNNANVYSTYQPENPVALRMLKSMVDTTKELDRPLNICGEIASDLRFLPILIGLGFEHISIDLHAVPRVKKFLSSLNVSACKKLIKECLKAEKTKEVKSILTKFNKGPGDKYEPETRKGESEAIDPICKMVVHTKGNKLTVTRGGKRFYFCHKQCRDTFMREGGIK